MKSHTLHGEIAIRTLAMPADANPAGDIFGGWVLGQMDIAGGIVARARAKGRLATVAVDAMTFKLPVFVGDLLTCHGKIERVGRTSIAVWVEAWATRGDGTKVLVTEGKFTYVAIDENRKPRTVPIDD
ncbi:MAG: acyl-CoA thioesterase [Alphaproteobacteria bacterium]|nr:acyl-CoA thioesterase [Alphaproteobacteria bacterium]